MWAVNQDYQLVRTNFLFGRNSFGMLHQPRLSWKNESIDIEHARYPSVGWDIDSALTVADSSVGAIWLACSLNKNTRREVQIVFGGLAARLRFVEWVDGTQNGSNEFRSYASSGTIYYLALELLESGVVTQSRIMHAAGEGAATLACGLCLVGGQWKFIAWGSATIENAPTVYGQIGQAAYGGCTAIVSADLAEQPSILSEAKSVEGVPSLRLRCAAQHIGPMPHMHDAIPELPAILLARAEGPPGSLRQRQQNSLLALNTLPGFDCGQMIELTRNSAESPFFVQSVAAYDYSESLPYLPITQASNLHHDPNVNALLERLQATVSIVVSNVGTVSATVTCTNDGSGLNEYRGSTLSGDTNVSVLISLLRLDRNTGTTLANTNLVVVYAVRIAIKATHPNGSGFSNSYKTLTAAEQQAFFSGGSVSVSGRSISAIGPA